MPSVLVAQHGESFRDHRIQLSVGHHGGERRNEGLLAFIVPKSEGAPHGLALSLGPFRVAAVMARKFGQFVPLAQHLVDDFAEVVFGGDGDDLLERRAEAATLLGRGLRHHGVEGSAAQIGLLPLVEHGEARRDPGLEGKSLQQPLAKTVDRVDFEPAARVERVCKEAPSAAEIFLLRRHTRQRGELGDEVGLGHGGPSRELLQQPVLHLCRRGLGIGEAEDRFPGPSRRAAAAGSA